MVQSLSPRRDIDTPLSHDRSCMSCSSQHLPNLPLEPSLFHPSPPHPLIVFLPRSTPASLYNSPSIPAFSLSKSTFPQTNVVSDYDQTPRLLPTNSRSQSPSGSPVAQSTPPTSTGPAIAFAFTFGTNSFATPNQTFPFLFSPIEVWEYVPHVHSP